MTKRQSEYTSKGSGNAMLKLRALGRGKFACVTYWPFGMDIAPQVNRTGTYVQCLDSFNECHLAIISKGFEHKKTVVLSS